MIEEAAGWVAPVATAMGAMMTASNINARVTGSGFIAFTVGSVGWSVVGMSTGQTNLVLTNAFLTLVNALGIWRWLGRQARYEQSAQAAVEASEHQPAARALLTISSLNGAPVYLDNGEQAGTVVETLIECQSATISYIVVGAGGVGGVGEKLRAIAPAQFHLDSDRIALRLDRDALDALPEWQPEKQSAVAGPP